MADKTAQQKKVQETAEEVSETTKPEESVPPAEEESKSENGDSTENGEPTEKENGQEEDDEVKTTTEDSTDKVCSIKRKSAGGDAPDDTPAEGATPEKKAKLGETAEAESNGEAEVAA